MIERSPRTGPTRSVVVLSPLPGVAGILLCAQFASANTLDVTSSSLTNGAEDELVMLTNGHVVLERREGAGRMHIDGRLDEAAWQGLEVHEDFRLIDPDYARARCAVHQGTDVLYAARLLLGRDDGAGRPTH